MAKRKPTLASVLKQTACIERIEKLTIELDDLSVELLQAAPDKTIEVSMSMVTKINRVLVEMEKIPVTNTMRQLQPIFLRVREEMAYIHKTASEALNRLH